MSTWRSLNIDSCLLILANDGPAVIDTRSLSGMSKISDVRSKTDSNRLVRECHTE
jgi:hypothetical protein